MFANFAFLTSAKIFLEKFGDQCSTHVSLMCICEIVFPETCLC